LFRRRKVRGHCQLRQLCQRCRVERLSNSAGAWGETIAVADGPWLRPEFVAFGGSSSSRTSAAPGLPARVILHGQSDSPATEKLPGRNLATMLWCNGPAPRMPRRRGGDSVATDQNNPTTSTGSSELTQVLREFTELIRGIRANDLSASDRAELRSLLGILTELQARTGEG
jgi:hypothetical protein